MNEPEMGNSIELSFLNKDFELLEAPYKILNEYLSKKYKDKYYHQKENKDEIN